ncbi:MAG: 23S rRNA (pseudouridine(1915)-N(3))-methyltransferase RlmH [Hyphomicrobium sp.]
MRLLIAAVGKLKDDAERDMCDRYQKRFNATGRSLGLGPLEFAELGEARGTSAEARKNDEAQRLIKLSSQAGFVIALEVEGRAITSASFATEIARQRDTGIKSLAILIGGPDGHGKDVLAAAGMKLSLGPLTLPHGLARVVLAEQLYRAVTILSGHPYHRA